MKENRLLRQIESAEHVSRLLEPSPQQRHEWLHKAEAYASRFIDNLPHSPAFQTPPDRNPQWETSFPEAPEEMDELLGFLDKEVDTPGLNPASGGHLGYIPGGGIFPSAIGDFLSDVFNRYAGIHFASPGAVELEHACVGWMRDLFGFPESSGGTLTSGGSIANLIAIVTARDAMQLRAASFHKRVIYLTEQVHHCVYKAIRIAGLGECVLRHVPMDEYHRMSVPHLQRLIAQDKQDGLNPFLICASAGTTDTGSVDPLDALADVAQQHSLWFHVDAAYGGFFMLSESLRQRLNGISRADSLVIDPHKGLFLPYGTGAVLIRDRDAMYRSHFYRANYMQDAHRNPASVSPADLSPELTRPFRGLRMWLPLKLFGIRPFIAALEEKVLLARWFREEIAKDPRFETGPEPDLSVTLFRYTATTDPNRFNETLVRHIHADGRVFLSSTTLNQEIWIRVAVLCFRTHRETIALALEVVRDAAEKTRKEWEG